MAKGNYQIPFDDKGNMLTYDWGYNVIHHVDNHEFEDELEYVDYGRGRSSVTFKFKRLQTGTTVEFFVSTFSDIIPHINEGKIHGRFTFVKQGSNYSCKLLTLMNPIPLVD